MISLGGAWSRIEPEGPYGEEAARVDEEICRLLAERDRLAAGERLHPGADRLRQWSGEFGSGESRLRSLFANLAGLPRREDQPPMPEGLRRVLEIMRRVERDGVTCSLTHCLQYENASVVHLELAASGRRIPHGTLELEVDRPECRTRYWGGHGGGSGVYGFDFIIWPALPDDLSQVTFTLRQGEATEPPAEPLELREPLAFAPDKK